MCGIAGVWYFNSKPAIDTSVIKKMTDCISHRGPDGEGHWYSADSLLHLGHRRLAIIDLTDGGKQPMVFDDKLVITFNGEIYNYIEIRETLIKKGHNFKSKSDTEVVLASYKEWGIDCLSHFDGMFAFAIYDISKNSLFCARDRFGEKPFYYSFYNGGFYFASEMKALWAAGVPRTPNYTMFYNYLAHDLVENPLNQTNTFFSDIYKLKASHFFIYNGQDNIVQERYWELSTDEVSDFSFSEASEKFMELLQSSIKRRLRSDVPVGTSLSGGLDSSTIVALISQSLPSNHTFSARFINYKKDEGSYIDLVKNKFNTKHHDIYVNADEYIEEVDKLIFHQEEPFQTGSIFAQYCVYKEARKFNIPVMLDGQGADELLCGYDTDFRFYLRELIQGKKDINKFLFNIKTNHSIDLNPGFKQWLRHRYPGLYRILSKISNSLSSKIPFGISKSFYQQYDTKESLFFEAENLKTMLKYELSTHGLEKLLRFADRNSMAHSVEVRLPFLNHELVEFVMSLKSSLFLHEGWSKAVLRNGVKNILPKEIVYRKDKIGFEAPHGEWMKHKKLADMMNDLKQKLTNDKIITSDYNQGWKIIIASKVLYGM